MVTRRIVRSILQLVFFITLIFGFIYILDGRYNVLPSQIHNHLPSHHPGFVITDITVDSCRFGKCNVDGYFRIEKDLYLGSGWITKSYVHVRRKKEEELKTDDRVVVDVRVGRLDPSEGEKSDAAEKWESRPGGIWLKRSRGRHVSDSNKAVTAVDVLFGADAVEPRPAWEIRDRPLLLDNAKEALEARLSIRRGLPPKMERPATKVGKDGRYKIMQISDLHLSTGLGVCRDAEPKNGGKCDADTRTLDFVGRLLDQEKPDLVVLGGDQVNGETAPDAQSAVFKLVDLFITRKIPYAAILGNHDDEGSLSRAATIDLYNSLPYSLTHAGPNTLPGYGNYYVQVLSHTSHHPALTVYFLDTHSYSPDEKKYPGYDWIKPEQIGWFKDTAGALKAENAKYSHIHLDMAFIHIPLPEYKSPGLMYGTVRESVTAPNYNSGFYDALVEMGVPLVSCGHDHANDFCMYPDKTKTPDPKQGTAGHPPTTPKPKFNNIWLCYAGGSGFGGYGGYGGYHRRIRFFELDANEARISTWKRLEYGDIEKRIDEHLIVEGGRVFSPPPPESDSSQKSQAPS